LPRDEPNPVTSKESNIHQQRFSTYIEKHQKWLKLSEKYEKTIGAANTLPGSCPDNDMMVDILVDEKNVRTKAIELAFRYVCSLRLINI
jgi:hypothetical protein